MTDWDDLRFFLAIWRAGNLTAAAKIEDLRLPSFYLTLYEQLRRQMLSDLNAKELEPEIADRKGTRS